MLTVATSGADVASGALASMLMHHTGAFAGTMIAYPITGWLCSSSFLDGEMMPRACMH